MVVYGRARSAFHPPNRDGLAPLTEVPAFSSRREVKSLKPSSPLGERGVDDHPVRADGFASGTVGIGYCLCVWL